VALPAQDLKFEVSADDGDSKEAEAKDSKVQQKDKIELKKWNAVGQSPLLASSSWSHLCATLQRCGAGISKSTHVRYLRQAAVDILLTFCCVCLRRRYLPKFDHVSRF
jgi:hypothetical protein